MASKKVYHEIKTDRFEVDMDAKTFTATCSMMLKIFDLEVWPWLKTTQEQIAEGDKNKEVPRIRMISHESGNRCTFFLTGKTKDEYIFMPSIGSLMNKKTGLPHLRNWKVIAKRV